jgi:MoxR-like ATPase
MGYDSRSKIPFIKPLVHRHELCQAQESVQKIFVSEKVAEYVYQLTQRTRQVDSPYPTLSTRAGLALVRAAQAYAFLQGRGFAIPEDIQYVAPAVLSHRLGLQEGIKFGKKKCSELLETTELKI